jgi:hypothetical protein
MAGGGVVGTHAAVTFTAIFALPSFQILSAVVVRAPPSGRCLGVSPANAVACWSTLSQLGAAPLQIHGVPVRAMTIWTRVSDGPSVGK